MRNSYIILLIIGIGIISYSHSLDGAFIWDDSYFILRNSAIHTVRNAPSFFTNPSTLASGKLAIENYRPLVTLSYAVDYMFWDVNPFGYHLTNTLFHVLNAMLVFLLIKNLAGKEAAFLTAMLFLVHPVQTEAVSWISGRSNVLFVFFYLAAFVLYIKSYAGTRGAFYLLSLLLFCFSLLSKEAALTLPFMICLYDVILRKEENKRRIFRWTPYFIILINYLLLRYYMLGRVSQRPYWGESLFQTWLTIPKLIKVYLQMLILPLDLCVDRHVAVVRSPLDMQFLLGLLALTLLLLIFFSSFRRKQSAAFFASWFIITLGPFLNIFPINILVAERFIYLSSIGIFFLFSLAILKLLGKDVRRFYFVSFLVILILAHLTINRNVEWKDELTLFKSDVKVEPWNARLHHNLGVAYIEEGEMEEAEREFKKAILLDKDFIHNYINLGKMYFKQGRFEAALDIVNKGLIVSPDDPELWNILAVLYIQKNRRHEAETILRRTIERNPGFFDAHLNLGRLLEENGFFDDAVSLYKNSLRYFDTSYEKAILWLRIAELYEKQELHDLARETYTYIITAFPEERIITSIVADRIAEP